MGTVYGGDLDIYYSSLTGDHFINCKDSRWTTDNYSITIETWLNKTQLQTLQNNTVPGATKEVYKIIDEPHWFDTTWKGENTLYMVPRTSHESNLKYMHSPKVCYVKNISSSPIAGQSGYINVKIECMISSNSNL